MNKVLIRNRQIDNNKQLPILIRDDDDLSDFNEYSNISRSSQILSGMDKGEESEHHLQKALQELQYEKSTINTAIPIPEVYEECGYETLYQSDFILPKHYIRLKTLEFEDELPEYDLDEEDQEWLDNSKLDVTPSKFEKIIEEFERACSQKALLLDEAKCLLRGEPVHIIIAIYDYWLTKRVRTGQPLYISVKAEKAERSNNTPIDPYIAFRKRSEKMTTRKNRRVDELSYERMYRLSCHMEKLSATINLVAEREATKRQITQTERDIFIKRCQSHDYNKLQWRDCVANEKVPPTTKLVDNFKFAAQSRDNNHKEVRLKRPHSAMVDRPEDDDIDFTFRPMAKCKYLPLKLSAVCNREHSLANTNITNTVVVAHSRAHGPTDPAPHQPHKYYSHLSDKIFTRLNSLYMREVNCGLRPLVMEPPPSVTSPPLPPPTIHRTNRHLTSIHKSSTQSLVPTTEPSSNPILGKRPLSDHNTVDDTRKRVSVPSVLNSHLNGSICTYQPTSLYPDDNHYSNHHSNNHINNYINNHSNNHRHQHNNNSKNNHSKHQPLSESDQRRHLYGSTQPLSPTTIKELVDPQSSLNNGYPSKLSQVVGFKCLKPFTHKRRIGREDIDEITSFYSNTNGHYHHNHHRNHHNHHRLQEQQKKWLNKKTADNCLKPTNLLPIWASEPHVMTSVNKIA